MMKAIVYADSSLNIIDGSSIWLATMAQLLATTFDEVHVVSKVAITEPYLVVPLRDNSHIVIHEPASDNEALTPAMAAESIAALVSQTAPKVVIVRGFEANAAAARHKTIAVRLFSYITDLQFPLRKLSPNGIQRLRRIAGASKRMFAQTESARSYLEAIAPEAAGKILLLPPVVPDSFFSARKQEFSTYPDGPTLNLVYAGKFARDWRTMEMLSLPAELQKRGIEAQLTMVGSKFQKDRVERTWHIEMEERLRRASADPNSGINWLGPMPRDQVAAILAKSDLGLGWRSPALDSSLELSSKILEYGAVNLPSLLNRTVDHEYVLGKNYPFFVEEDSVSAVADLIAGQLSQLRNAGSMSRRVAERHSFANSAAALRKNFEEMSVFDELPSRRRAHRLAVVTHDDKFLGDLLDLFNTLPDINARIDRWQTLHSHKEDVSSNTTEWAETILCEWAGPNAVWHSNNKRRGTRLIVRLHAFELRGPWLDQINIAAVDDWVFVSAPYKELTIERLGLDPVRCHVIPNALDTRDLDRPKIEGAQYNIGLVGYVTFNKRPDRALDVLEHLLARDERYMLYIKGRAPWEYAYEWKKLSQRVAYVDFYDRISNSPKLREHVAFEPFGTDISTWLRKIGFVLSPSNEESFHLAPAEGMASGAVPLVWDRRGATDIFGAHNVYLDSHSVATRILSLRDPEEYSAAGGEAKSQAQTWATRPTHKLWIELLRNSSTGAKRG